MRRSRDTKRRTTKRTCLQNFRAETGTMCFWPIRVRIRSKRMKKRRRTKKRTTKRTCLQNYQTETGAMCFWSLRVLVACVFSCAQRLPAFGSIARLSGRCAAWNAWWRTTTTRRRKRRRIMAIRREFLQKRGAVSRTRQLGARIINTRKRQESVWEKPDSPIRSDFSQTDSLVFV